MHRPLNKVTCYTDCGNSWTTDVAADIGEQQAINYFLGNWFNIGFQGSNEDNMVEVTAIKYESRQS